MNVAVFCEESQATTIELRKMGVNAFSFDLKECSGGHPEWHVKGNCLPYLDGRCTIKTMDGKKHMIDGKWDLIIAHPTCTYLSFAGNRWFNVERYGEKAIERMKERELGAEFFMKFINADCDHIAVENPVGYMNSTYRKADQIIQPWQFGDGIMKRTCFWLKGLNPLTPSVTEEPEMEFYYWTDSKGRNRREPKWYRDARHSGSNYECSEIRSKTFPGVARAMASQWIKEVAVCGM